MSLKKDLYDFLNNYDKLFILGVGNILKGDDGAGSFIISNLNIKNKNIICIDGQTMPENFTGLIRRENPSHLLIIDACLMNEKYGRIKFVNNKDFVNIGISTHSMSLSYFVKYLEKDLNLKVAFIGIEPKSMEYSEELTLEVYESCIKFINLLEEYL